MIDLMAIQKIIVKRPEPPLLLDGHYEEKCYHSENIFANVQPLSGRELDQLPEGDRTKDHRTIFTRSKLQVQDIVVLENVDYEILMVETWDMFCAKHYKARAVKVNECGQS